MCYLAAYVKGKGWRGLGFGAGGRKNVDSGIVLGVVTPSAESPAKVKAVELAVPVVRGTIRLQRLQTVGHPERDQLH
jgi:hypothetical protein